VTAPGAANQLQAFEAPTGPTQDLTAYFRSTANGQPAYLSQAISSRAGQQEWRLVVQSKAGGPVQLSWPNVSTVPRSVAFRLVDPTNGQAIDLRAKNSIVYNAAPNSTREFRVQTVQAATVGPAITNVMISPGQVAARQPVTARFNLDMDATVTVKVLNSRGAEVAVVRNGEFVSRGANSAAWDLRDGSGNVIAPGSYQLEIVAGSNGQSSRKVTTFSVAR